METSVRRRFFGQLSFLDSLHGKPQACVYLITWRAKPEPQWRAENKSRGRLSPPTSGNRMILPAFFGKELGQSPYPRTWKRTCSS